VKFLDASHPFFAPRWRRWATAGLPITWGVVEVILGNPGWAVLFIGAGAYAGYVLLWAKP